MGTVTRADKIGYYVSNEGIHMGKKYPTLVRITPEEHLWKNMNPAAAGLPAGPGREKTNINFRHFSGLSGLDSYQLSFVQIRQRPTRSIRNFLQCLESPVIGRVSEG